VVITNSANSIFCLSSLSVVDPELIYPLTYLGLCLMEISFGSHDFWGVEVFKILLLIQSLALEETLLDFRKAQKRHLNQMQESYAVDDET